MSLKSSSESTLDNIDSSNPVKELENMVVGSFEVIPPSEQIKYPYVLYVPPNNLNVKTNIMMWGAGTVHAETPEQQAQEIIEGSIPDSIMSVCEQFQIACITPVLPRDRINGINLDAQILSRATMLDTTNCPDYYKGPDKEILKMLKQVRMSLQSIGNTVDDKFIFAGISAGANQANRLSLLYPQIVKASAVLSAGDYFYPEGTINGQRIGYPFGTADIELIEQQQFDREEFKQIRHLFYIGKQDVAQNRDPFSHDLNGNQELVARLGPLLGTNQVDRGLRYVDHLTKMGMDLELIFREDLGHGVDGKVMSKLIEFIKASL